MIELSKLGGILEALKARRGICGSTLTHEITAADPSTRHFAPTVLPTRQSAGSVHAKLSLFAAANSSALSRMALHELADERVNAVRTLILRAMPHLV